MRFFYSKAGVNAPPGVKAAIAQFRALPEKLKYNQVLLYFLLGSGTMPYKMSQVDSNYQPTPRGLQNCANCEMAYRHVASGRFICSQIEGEIRPEGWCRLWVPPAPRSIARSISTAIFGG